VLKPQTRNRAEIPAPFKWDVSHVFPDWAAWGEAYRALETGVGAFALRRGSLASGPAALLSAFRAQDDLGQLAYRVYYYPSLQHDQDQRDNEVDARRQQVEILLARWQEATSWFNPELLAIPIETLRAWLDADAELVVYRFVIENLFRQCAHVLDAQGERLLALAGRFESSPADAFGALSTADVAYPAITLHDGREARITYGEYRSILSTSREQADRRAAFQAYHGIFAQHRNTYAALYNAVCQRDWFAAQARGYASTLDAAVFGNNIPVAVVETLITVAREGAGPLQRYHRLRKSALGLTHYYLCDNVIPVLAFDRAYDYTDVRAWVTDSVAPLGRAYQDDVRQCFANGSIDVYENEGKRTGAYSAPVYGVHPYMLLNHNDTLDAVFTLAHEMGHTLHSVLAHRAQPFVYADYTIFVAEVASTLNEHLLLDYLLERCQDPRERIVLLQHALEGISGTFYTQSLFADFELRIHRMVEHDEPVTADGLCAIYADVLHDFYGDVFDDDPLARVTWARIPHFFQSPYYVYQYATCFASAAQISDVLLHGTPQERTATVERYLALLAAGGNDYPMTQLRRAGVDLSEAETVRAVVRQFDGLVSRLEQELAALSTVMA
jgi:oligoendopeptidase F